MFEKGAWLGQIPLVLGPSSWGSGMMNSAIPMTPPVTPPYYGQWGVHEGGGMIGAHGQVGPFSTAEEAFSAAAKAAVDAGATELPTDGFAQVVDSKGQPAGPIT